MQQRLILVAALAFLVPATEAKDQPQLTVEVLKAETTDGTGTTKTDCDLNDANVTCVSTTHPVAHTARIPTLYQVNLIVRMPDGSTVEVQCHRTTSLMSMMTTCQQPEPGTYAAKIDKHAIRLLIPVGKPEYNKDGTKKAAKTGTQEVKFSFR